MPTDGMSLRNGNSRSAGKHFGIQHCGCEEAEGDTWQGLILGRDARRMNILVSNLDNISLS